MKPTEKHLILISTESEDGLNVTFKNKGRWDVPNEISYSKLQLVLDSLCSGEPMGPCKVFIVNVNNCEAYSDYWEGNRGVYPTYQAAVDAMTEQGFDPSTRIKLTPWYEDEEDWRENGWYDREEYRIEEWEMAGK